MNIHICHIYISRVCHTEPETTDYPIYSSWVNVCYYFLVDSNVMLALATDTLYTALPGTNIILPPNRLCYSSRIPYSHFPFPRKNPHTISNPNPNPVLLASEPEEQDEPSVCFCFSVIFWTCRAFQLSLQYRSWAVHFHSPRKRRRKWKTLVFKLFLWTS